MAFKLVLLSCLLCLARAGPGEAIETRVVGGTEARPHQFPHQVSLQLTSPPMHFCGGSVLSERWILTAAHCVEPSPGNFVVKAGKHRVNVHESSEQTSAVQTVYRHKLYGGQAQPFDIALVKLSTPLKFNRYVQPINLPAPGSEPRGTAILSGWGSVSGDRRMRMPQALQTASFGLLDAASCKAAFTRADPRMRADLHPSNVCTAPGSGTSACKGDSGGPLISTSNEIIGIVSWGSVPCSGRTPSVYTKVSSFIDWIQMVMQK